jgi:hypothetical protein
MIPDKEARIAVQHVALALNQRVLGDDPDVLQLCTRL